MKEYKNLFFYLFTLVSFGFLMYWITKQGEMLESSKLFFTGGNGGTVSAGKIFKESFLGNLHHPIALLLLQIVSIIVVSRIFSLIFKKIGQPSVIGEITAGIVLGPSVLGYFIPEASAFLFPVKSLDNLQFLSQFGLILFMFVVGMELDVKVLKNKAKEAVVISHASIIIPYFFGMVLAYFLYKDFAPENISFLSFSLFMGIAMSITAFPVLARIIQERDMTKTRLGTIAITCAAADDITAWCILAAVVAVVKAGSMMSAIFTILLAIIYLLAMLYIVKPYLRKVGSIFFNKETVNKWIVALIFVILLLSAYTTEVIGIHALFGAFLAGVIMPDDANFRKTIIEKIEDISLVLLLPLFFVFTGLRTQIGLLNDGYLWWACGLVILVAIMGKFAGSALTAKFIGLSWHDSLSIGTLMNTRGLMELVVLNIGYDLGILPPTIFAIMVIMALFTTFITSPALSFIRHLFPEKEAEAPIALKDKYITRIMISFGPVQSGLKLLGIAGQLISRQSNCSVITALHLTHGTEVSPLKTEEFEAESFLPIKKKAQKLGLNLKTKYRVTDNIDKEIIRIIKKERCELLLVGAGKSPYRDTFIGSIIKSVKTINPKYFFEWMVKGKSSSSHIIHEKARWLMDKSSCAVGVFLDRGFTDIEKIVMPVFHTSDIKMLLYLESLLINNQAQARIIDSINLFEDQLESVAYLNSLKQQQQNKMITLTEFENFSFGTLGEYDLLLLSYESWKILVKYHKEWLAVLPSTLIINPK